MLLTLLYPTMGGKDEMTKASVSLQDLRRRMYAKAKAELALCSC